MEFLTDRLPALIDTFLAHFDDLLKNDIERRRMRQYVTGLLMSGSNKTMTEMARHIVGANNQSLHHFLTQAPWDPDALNLLRAEFLQRSRQTQFKATGWFIQDDTGQLRKPSKGVRGSDGVACQYIGNVGKVDEGIVFVSTHYADERKHFPVTSELFWPKAAIKVFEERQEVLRARGEEARSVTEKMKRDKIDIALEQIREAKALGTACGGVMADSWYGSSPRYVKGIEAEGLEYIVELRSNRTVFVRLPGDPRSGPKPEHSVKEALTLFEKEDFEQLIVKRADGTEDVRYVVSMKIKVKGLGKGRRRLVFVASDLDRLDPDHVEFLLVDTRLSDAEIAQAYTLRNWVEVFYGDGKGELALAGAQVRYEDGYARHWALVFLAHTLVMHHRMKGSFSGLVEKRGSPVSARACA
jgi:SRSO17 transposase